MEAERFDDIARALGLPMTRRRLFKAATKLFAATVLGQTVLTRARSLSVAAQATVCNPGEILCWNSCYNPLSNDLNCGMCGESCGPDRHCTDGVCVASGVPRVGCPARLLRIQMGAFIPGSAPGAVSPQIVDGILRSLIELEVGEDDRALIIASRYPAIGPPTTGGFSPDSSAPILAGFTVDIGLEEFEVTRSERPVGEIVQVARVASKLEPICRRAIRQDFPFGDPESEGNRVRIPVDGTWELERGPLNNDEPGCLLDQAELPPVRVLGILEVVRDDAAQIVKTRFIASDDPAKSGMVSRFPAFEFSASLDDGNFEPLVRQSPTESWVTLSEPLVNVTGEPCTSCEGGVFAPAEARLLCGCPACIGGQDCQAQFSTTTCTDLPSYLVLSSSQSYNPMVDMRCADPTCPIADSCTDPCRNAYIAADGQLSVFLDNDTEPAYRSDQVGTGWVAPIGILAKAPMQVRVVGSPTGRTQDALRRLFLHRVYRSDVAAQTQPPPESGLELITLPDGLIEATLLVTLGPGPDAIPICCPDGSKPVCVDRTMSVLNCGGCNQPCGPDQVCVGGICQCPEPLVLHSGLCVDPTQDNENCGPFFENCTAQQKVCARSLCLDPHCTTAGFHVCNEACFRMDDKAHCGPDCIECRIPAFGDSTCDGTTCGIACFDNFHQCDQDCFSNFDPATCGAMCTPCDPRPSATAHCDNGQFCEYRCDPGFHDCSGVCVNSFAHETCGANCSPCASDEICLEAKMCCHSSATMLCGDACTFTNEDANNCGGCGQQCSSGLCCVGGSCSGIIGTFEHCTECYKSCVFPETCEGGQCVVLPIEPPDTDPPEPIFE